MDPSSIALQALHQADAQLEKAAAGIANAGAASQDGNSLDVVELSAEITALMSAQTLFEANLAAVETADQMQKSAIDAIA
jgi:flagellar hook protein FlgE